MKYYLKKLGHQELGSVSSVTGVPSRGRYIYISKDPNVLSVFPPLSRAVLNDISLLPIIPLYNNEVIKSYCSYVYHNDKYHGSLAKSPRNEYRLYLNTMLENNKLLYEKDDIVIFKTANIYENIEGVFERQTIHYVDLIKEGDIEYQHLNDIVNQSNIRGSHAIYNGRLDFFEEKIESITNVEDTVTVTEKRVDSSVTQQLEKTDEDKVAQLFNASNFRDFIMVGYEELCAVSRTVIRSNRFLNLEAAHIKPNSHGGLFLPNNGLALSRDLHWAFDKGFFTINDDYTIRVHDKVTSSYLKSYHGEKIHVPNDQFFRPDKENLIYHQDEIFGLFLTSGRL